MCKSTEKSQVASELVTAANQQKQRVLALVDGFNLYHSLDLAPGVDDNERHRYRKYKWLCLTSLVRRFLAPQTDELVGVQYFTAFPTWDEAKRLRHETYVSAQKLMKVVVTPGEFKKKTVKCYATCRQDFSVNVEKQTDINIATTMIDRANEYDKLLLLTADSDQVPSIKLLLKLYPEKTVAVIVPIGRHAKELKRACGGNAYRITEDHLRECQFPQMIPILNVKGQQVSILVKPSSW